jgi:GAF domain-containing protein
VVDDERRDRLWRAIAGRAEAPDQDRWAQAVCAACVAVLAGVDAAVLTVRASSRAQQLLGASDEWSAELAQTQYMLGEGPGVDAVTTGEPVLVADVNAVRGLWPGFAQAAAEVGVGAVFAFPLQVGGIRFGSLELLCHHRGPLGDREVTDAVLLAELATSALLDDAGQAEAEGRDWLSRSVASYQDVHVATGMLAGTLLISIDDAFARLRAHAFAQNRPLLEVARDVVRRRINLNELAD